MRICRGWPIHRALSDGCDSLGWRQHLIWGRHRQWSAQLLALADYSASRASSFQRQQPCTAALLRTPAAPLRSKTNQDRPRREESMARLTGHGHCARTRRKERRPGVYRVWLAPLSLRKAPQEPGKPLSQKGLGAIRGIWYTISSRFVRQLTDSDPPDADQILGSSRFHANTTAGKSPARRQYALRGIPLRRRGSDHR